MTLTLLCGCCQCSIDDLSLCLSGLCLGLWFRPPLFALSVCVCVCMCVWQVQSTLITAFGPTVDLRSLLIPLTTKEDRAERGGLRPGRQTKGLHADFLCGPDCRGQTAAALSFTYNTFSSFPMSKSLLNAWVWRGRTLNKHIKHVFLYRKEYFHLTFSCWNKSYLI